MTDTVQIKFDKFGRPLIKGVGFSGEGCKLPLSQFQKAVSAEAEIHDTADMHQISTIETEEQSLYE